MAILMELNIRLTFASSRDQSGQNGLESMTNPNVTFFVQLGFSSDRVTTEKVQYNTDLLERRHKFLYRNDGVINN